MADTVNGCLIDHFRLYNALVGEYKICKAISLLLDLFAAVTMNNVYMSIFIYKIWKKNHHFTLKLPK